MMVSDPRGGAPPSEAAAPVTPGMIAPLRRAQPWALFVALYGFLCAALAGISAIYGWMQPDGRVLGALEWGLAMAWLLCAYPLFCFATALRRIRPGAGTAPLEEALAHQHTFLRILGIALLLEVALVSLAISVSLLPMLEPPEDGAPPPQYSSVSQACEAEAPELVCATVAFFDPDGKLKLWTGWHKFVPKETPPYRIASHSDNGVQLFFEDPDDRRWELHLLPPRGKVLAPGEYTGAKTGHSETSSLSLQMPEAWWPVESERSDQRLEWRGECFPVSFGHPLLPSGRLQLQSRFTVREIQWDRNGQARRISIDFERSCTGRQGTWLVLGRVRAIQP
jgi:hypothetical protein